MRSDYSEVLHPYVCSIHFNEHILHSKHRVSVKICFTIDCMIDTNFHTNIRRASPFLGTILVVSVVFGFMYMIYVALRDFTNSLQTTITNNNADLIEGSVELDLSGDVYYGDTIAYKTRMFNEVSKDLRVYITTTCFQDNRMVFEKNSSIEEKVYLYDGPLSGYVWDGHEALCTAVLMCRTESSNSATIQMLGYTYFTVKARGY